MLFIMRKSLTSYVSSMRIQLIKTSMLIALCGFMALISSQVFAEPVAVKVAFLTEKLPTPPALSNLDPILTDSGIQGAKLGVKDNNTTGQFTGHHYDLKHLEVPVGGDVFYRHLRN